MQVKKIRRKDQGNMRKLRVEMMEEGAVSCGLRVQKTEDQSKRKEI